MTTEPAIDRIKRDLHGVIDDMRGELDRVELLTAAMIAFSQPIPDYDLAFQNIYPTSLSAHQIG